MASSGSGSGSGPSRFHLLNSTGPSVWRLSRPPPGSVIPMPKNLPPWVPEIRPPSPPRAYKGLSKLKRALADEQMMMLAFSEWKEDLGRSYPTMEEERLRYEAFKLNVACLVSLHPDDPTLSISCFGDRTREELGHIC